MAETAPPKPAFAPTRSLPLPGGAKLVFCSGVTARGSAAETAGLAAGDEWLGLTVGAGKATTRWRLNKLDDVLLYAGTATKVSACVARDQRLLELPLAMPRGATSWRLLPRDTPLLGRWLNAP